MKNLMSLLAAGLLLGSVAPLASEEKPLPRGLYAIFETSQGRITCLLYEKEAPKTVRNFTGLALGKKEWTDPKTGRKQKKPLYDGTVFHRVIPDFMIQGGDPLGVGIGGPGYQFEDECTPKLGFDRTGRLAMANAGPNTNGSQFFITVAPTPWLNGKHTIFGQVVSGQEVVDQITRVKRDRNDRPLQDVVLKKVIIEDRTKP
ncbi:MAG TPA: peptidylprolyl isomerase [bacterium]|uniref:Peptidyl-prolyl cis-trans isomerase n=1 Tax=candidate division TA06 bacterium ADurb.Bin417 TaxID=1852828 RepID=A0A1V5MLJ5_UNCT6|nr:MAG: Peptidyl-prolyl cis-trans isomerase B [candidate division TA06 bacterium ADurb.Bin417]HNQ36022.1 peptidylprolyl isomerase [bacterium]HNS49505.1 peptidylprolyl isomerase [bacterium]